MIIESKAMALMGHLFVFLCESVFSTSAGWKVLKSQIVMRRSPLNLMGWMWKRMMMLI
jgi:hypothetical protein